MARSSDPPTAEATLVPRLDGEVMQSVVEGLTQHAAASGVEPRNERPLQVTLRTNDGALVGGLVGNTVWGWLDVKLLWVAEGERGSGYGRKLLLAAEEEARRRGCHHAVLDTFSFQARGFYERLGYTAFGSLDDFPRGHQRIYLKKAL